MSPRVGRQRPLLHGAIQPHQQGLRLGPHEASRIRTAGAAGSQQQGRDPVQVLALKLATRRGDVDAVASTARARAGHLAPDVALEPTVQL